jgi:hypothetical protein
MRQFIRQVVKRRMAVHLVVGGLVKLSASSGLEAWMNLLSTTQMLTPSCGGCIRRGHSRRPCGVGGMERSHVLVVEALLAADEDSPRGAIRSAFRRKGRILARLAEGALGSATLLDGIIIAVIKLIQKLH